MDSFRSLLITRHAPFPPMGGAALRNLQNVQALAELGPVDMISLASGPSASAPPALSRWRHFDLHELRSERTVRSRLWARTWWLRPRRHPWSDALLHPRVARAMEDLIAELGHDLVVLEEVWLQPYLEVVRRRGCRAVFDAHNVEGELRRAITSTALPESRPAPRARRLWTRVRSLERDLVRRADQTWACSQRDAELLERCAGRPGTVRIVPNTVDPGYYRPIRDGELRRAPELPGGVPIVAFVGAYSYGPNEHAARVLVHEVLPALARSRADVALLLIGRDPAPWMEQAARSRRDVLVTGAVPDVRPFLAACDVVAVPLVHGGGTRLKILEAFAAGRPVVSTGKGAEGLDVVDGVHLLLREPGAGFAAAILELLDDAAAATRLAERALALVEERYSWRTAASCVRSALSPWLCAAGRAQAGRSPR